MIYIEAALEILEREPLDQQPIIDLPTNIDFIKKS
jgi:hypothetical protein